MTGESRMSVLSSSSASVQRSTCLETFQLLKVTDSFCPHSCSSLREKQHIHILILQISRFWFRPRWDPCFSLRSPSRWPAHIDLSFFHRQDISTTKVTGPVWHICLTFASRYHTVTLYRATLSYGVFQNVSSLSEQRSGISPALHPSALVGTRYTTFIGLQYP